jgi:hypothetical protein
MWEKSRGLNTFRMHCTSWPCLVPHIAVNQPSPKLTWFKTNTATGPPMNTCTSVSELLSYRLCQSSKHWQETESVISLINAALGDVLCIQIIVFVQLSFVLQKTCILFYLKKYSRPMYNGSQCTFCIDNYATTFVLQQCWCNVAHVYIQNNVIQNS